MPSQLNFSHVSGLSSLGSIDCSRVLFLAPSLLSEHVTCHKTLFFFCETYYQEKKKEPIMAEIRVTDRTGNIIGNKVASTNYTCQKCVALLVEPICSALTTLSAFSLCQVINEKRKIKA